MDRPLTPDDVPAWASLLAEADAVDRTGLHLGEADLHEQLADARTGPEDVVGCFEGDRLVAVATATPRGESEGAFTVALGGTVAPERRGRGIGTRLLARSVARARVTAGEQGPGLPVRLTAVVREDDQERTALLIAAGMRAGRRTLAMRRELTDLPPAPAPPPGCRLVAYEPADAERLRTAHNAAFGGGQHPGFTPWSPQAWRQWVTGSRAFRPGVTRLAVDDTDGSIAGYVVTLEYDAATAATGRRDAHVSRVGTLPAHRGRGLALALLGHCLHAYAEQGYDDASLHVDADNVTGARRVYERAGFEVQEAFVGYASPVA